MREVDRAKTLALQIHLSLYFLLSGERAAAERLIGGQDRFASLQDAIETVPPLVDLGYEEIRALVGAVDEAAGGAFVIPLRDATGATCLSVRLVWVTAAEGVSGIPRFDIRVLRVDRHDGVPWRTAGSPDSEGRLPRDQFVGSPGLRLERLFTAHPDCLEAVDRGPRNDREAAFLLRYADGDICNGGLAQFYSNSAGNIAGHFPELADRIGAVRKGAVVGQANLLFEGIDLSDWWARNARLDAFASSEDEALDQLTTEYYEAEESIDVLLVRFIEARPEAFLC